MSPEGTIRIAIQKTGRLSEGSLLLLRQMGLQFESYQGRLFTPCRNLSADILFLRDDDIPEYVEDGVADLGIVGSNVLEERGSGVERLLPLDFGFCSLALAVPEQSSIDTTDRLEGMRIATSYPRTLRAFLRKKKLQAEVVVLKGCVEIAPALKVADAICDLVSTGSTLRTNRLRTIETIAESRALLVGTRGKNPEKRALIDRLLLRAKGVQEARKVKYIMFNAPKTSLPALTALVRGCRSFTVVPLADPAFVAVRSVVPEDDFWDIAERLRAFGGTDILVSSSIEQFIR
ncbi:MAG: ATP phosphoribosyltransferase [Candidatus Peribacteraceae bacterium]